MKNSMMKLLPNDELKINIRPDMEEYEVIKDAIKISVDQSNLTGSRLETNAYHAKVLTPDDAKKLLKLDIDVNLPDLPKTIIPYDHARKVIIKNHERILLINCACRSLKGDKACSPRNVCMLLGEPWVSFYMEHNADSYKKLITVEEALEIIDEQHKLGNVQSIFLKDVMGDRSYGLCNCCTCCCTALMGYNYAKVGNFAASGYVREVDSAKCKNCGTCVEYCHFHVPEMVDGKMVADNSKCMGCTVCVDKCPNGAITIKRDDPLRNEPLDVDVLVPKYMNQN